MTIIKPVSESLQVFYSETKLSKYAKKRVIIPLLLRLFSLFFEISSKTLNVEIKNVIKQKTTIAVKIKTSRFFISLVLN